MGSRYDIEKNNKINYACYQLCHNFSHISVGYRDYPAIFNYIRNKTGVSKLYLVAHSMGTSSLMALLSEYPEYNEYFHAVSFLAPIGYLYHATIQFQILGLLGGPLEVIFL